MFHGDIDSTIRPGHSQDLYDKLSEFGDRIYRKLCVIYEYKMSEDEWDDRKDATREEKRGTKVTDGGYMHNAMPYFFAETWMRGLEYTGDGLRAWTPSHAEDMCVCVCAYVCVCV